MLWQLAALWALNLEQEQEYIVNKLQKQLSTVMAEKAALEARRREWANRRGGSHSSLQSPAIADPDHPIVQCVVQMEAAYGRIAALDAAADRIIGYWRGFAGRALLAVAKHRVAAERIAAAYKLERTTNHAWEARGSRRALRRRFFPAAP